MLAIQASSVTSEQAFSAARFMIGDHRYSLANDSFEISVLFRDWVNAERRNTGLPLLSSQIDEIFGENSDMMIWKQRNKIDKCKFQKIFSSNDTKFTKRIFF